MASWKELPHDRLGDERSRRCALDPACQEVEVQCYAVREGTRRKYLTREPWWLYVVMGIWFVKFADRYLGPQAVDALYAIAAAGLICHFAYAVIRHWNTRAEKGPDEPKPRRH